MIDVSIIIVNYNTRELTAQAITSALKQKGVSYEIIVVDNASQDQSCDYLQQQFGQQIKLIASEVNLGFGRANNLAFQHSSGNYLYLLNPDAELESECGLADFIDYAKQHPQYGLIGNAIFEPRKNRWVQPQSRYPAQKYLTKTAGLVQLPGKIAWVLGASMLIPRAAYKQVHGFDADFFLYGEETDLCLRIRKAGYEIGFCETVKVQHISGATEMKAVPKETWLRKQKGFYLFCSKHYHPDDIKHIARRQLRRAYFKKISLLLQKFLGKNVDARLQRIEATLETAGAAFNTVADVSKRAQ